MQALDDRDGGVSKNVDEDIEVEDEGLEIHCEKLERQGIRLKSLLLAWKYKLWS